MIDNLNGIICYYMFQTFMTERAFFVKTNDINEIVLLKEFLSLHHPQDTFF
ncbi:hypothetical protein [Deferribacter desulfuricans]|uniref:hypothetical protein n=1 Tax=Deferribacter desulfuricans TaxID=197162 RepID=UPI0002E7C9C9|nr:hypothetical protein [Deferribacter desulfuricans]